MLQQRHEHIIIDVRLHVLVSYNYEEFSLLMLVFLFPSIEHLDPPVLDRVPESVFGVLRPKVVAMTTPNAEFNVLFPGFSGFRHADHRFEWTRKEFQLWLGYNLVVVHPYTTASYIYSATTSTMSVSFPDSNLQ